MYVRKNAPTCALRVCLFCSRKIILRITIITEAHHKDTETEVCPVLFSLSLPRWNCWEQILFCVLRHRARSPCQSRRSGSIVSLGPWADSARPLGAPSPAGAAGEGRAAPWPWLGSLLPFQLRAVSRLGSCRGAVKGPAGLLRSLRRNGNESIRFHGNHFEGPPSGRRCLGSCAPRLGCQVDCGWRVASFPSRSRLVPFTACFPQYMDSLWAPGAQPVAGNTLAKSSESS